MAKRKLGRPSNQRKALLRNQVTNLLWYGKIETTLARAKEVSSVAEHLIALAVRTYDKTIELKKETKNDKQQIVVLDVVNDAPEKLAARRQIMRTLYEIPATRGADEDKDDFLARQKAVKHPVVEKLFREHAPKYRARQQEKGIGASSSRARAVATRPRWSISSWCKKQQKRAESMWQCVLLFFVLFGGGRETSMACTGLSAWLSAEHIVCGILLAAHARHP